MWLKIYAMHGPGHQSETEEYVWREKKPSPNERQEMFENMAERHYLNNASGKVTLVKVLPEKVRQEKIRYCKLSIEHDMKMLKILGAPVLEPFVF